MLGIWIAISGLLGSLLDIRYLLWNMLSLIAIAASGNVINDVLDVKNDTYNVKDRNPVGKEIERGWAKGSAILLGSAGLLIALIGSLVGQVDVISLSTLILTLLLVWGYSYKFQKHMLVGNVIVGLLCTVPILLTGLSYGLNAFEITFSGLSPLIPERFLLIKPMLGFYMVFAFILTLIRELVKDVQDRQGDERAGYRTLAVVIGIEFSRLLIFAIASICLLLESTLVILLYRSSSILNELAFALTFLLPLPMLVIAIEAWRLNTARDAAKLSLYLKIAMLLGISTTAFFWFL